MRCFLIISVFSIAIIVSCYGQCRISLPNPDHAGAPGCVTEGMFMTFGSTISKNCGTYSCNKDGSVSFCNNGVHIVQYPHDCKVIKTADGCGEKAVKIDDETIECIDGVAAVVKRDIQ